MSQWKRNLVSELQLSKNTRDRKAINQAIRRIVPGGDALLSMKAWLSNDKSRVTRGEIIRRLDDIIAKIAGEIQREYATSAFAFTVRDYAHDQFPRGPSVTLKIDAEDLEDAVEKALDAIEDVDMMDPVFDVYAYHGGTQIDLRRTACGDIVRTRRPGSAD